MSSPVPRVSIDSLTSPQSSPPINEFPFRSDSSHRASSVAPYRPRRGSTASSIHSIGGVLDSSSSWPYTVVESGQNAISTLLQPPIVRTGLVPHTAPPASSGHKQPTSRDIPPVALSNIPHIESSSFTPYLSQVGSLYDALQRARESEEQSSQGTKRGSKQEDLDEYVEQSLQPQGRRKLSRQPSFASISSLSSEPTPRRRSSGGPTRRVPQGPTPLSTIPNVYFDQDFHLENPRTFDVVSERSEVVRPTPGTPERNGTNGTAPGPRKALATNAILQEKLSWYMDTIEVHLIASISSASSYFFAALGSLRDLHAEAADSVDRIRILRQELEILDKEVAVSGLDVVKQKRRRENLKQLSDTVHQLRLIAEGVSDCEALVDAGEVEKALDAIDGVERLAAGEAYSTLSRAIGHLRDLRNATALQNVNGNLDIIQFRIGKTFESRFLGTLLGDLRRHVNTVSSQDILQRWSNASNRSRGNHNRRTSVFPTFLTVDDQFRSTLLQHLKGLHRANYTSPATTLYKEAAMKEIRSLIRRPLPSSSDDDNMSTMSGSTVGGTSLTQQEKSSILARNLRALDEQSAEDLLLKIYISVGETLRRLGTQIKVLLDVSGSLEEPQGNGGKSPLSPKPGGDALTSSMQLQEEIHRTLDMSNLLGQAVDLAQNQIVKVLRVRSDQVAHLSLQRFLRYFVLNRHFANECEAVSGRSGQALKNVVNGHIQDFSHQLAETERQRLAQGMESDQWNAQDFSEPYILLLSQILDSSTRDPDAWTETTYLWLPCTVDNDIPIPNGSSAPSAKEKTRPAKIEEDSFILPASALLCLRGITQHLHLISNIPSITAEVATTLVSYLQVFDSRCKQLILGAGATRSAGLKNITTKHLALASQALAFVTTLIPHIREFIRRHAPTGAQTSTLMGEFDKVKRSYQEHQSSIYDKLADIMSGRSTTHVRLMEKINWDQPDAEVKVNTYMETLTKETATLYRVLSKHLPDMTVQMIMAPVFQSYKTQWSRAFSNATVATEKGKLRLLEDARYFSARIGKLDGAGDVGDVIVNLVEQKEVTKSTPLSEPASSPPTTQPETDSTPTTNGTNDNEKKAGGSNEAASDEKKSSEESQAAT